MASLRLRPAIDTSRAKRHSRLPDIAKRNRVEKDDPDERGSVCQQRRAPSHNRKIALLLWWTEVRSIEERSASSGSSHLTRMDARGLYHGTTAPSGVLHTSHFRPRAKSSTGGCQFKSVKSEVRSRERSLEVKAATSYLRPHRRIPRHATRQASRPVEYRRRHRPFARELHVVRLPPEKRGVIVARHTDLEPTRSRRIQWQRDVETPEPT